jgi:hypothetical protein
LHRFDLDTGVEFEELSVALDYEAPSLEHALRDDLFVPKTDGIAVFDSRTGDSPLVEPVMYADIDKVLHFAAGRSVLAHLIDVVDAGRGRADPAPAGDARFTLV